MPIKKKTEKEIAPSVFDESKTLTRKVAQPYFSKKKLAIGCIILTLIVILGIILYYYFQNQNAQKLLKNPVLASEVEQENLVTHVGKLTQLPAGEQPAVAKVTDITKLKNQPFFQRAQNGNYVLIYQKANIAILYDPVNNKILQISPISTYNKPVEAASTTKSSVSVVIYNGTTKAGYAKTIDQELSQQLHTIIVTATANASNQTYTTTTVVDLTGKNAAVATQIAGILHGSVGSLPAGETKPANTDILVILGASNQPTP